jgi:hypothetical protein
MSSEIPATVELELFDLPNKGFQGHFILKDSLPILPIRQTGSLFTNACRYNYKGTRAIEVAMLRMFPYGDGRT